MHCHDSNHDGSSSLVLSVSSDAFAYIMWRLTPLDENTGFQAFFNLMAADSDSRIVTINAGIERRRAASKGIFSWLSPRFQGIRLFVGGILKSKLS